MRKAIYAEWGLHSPLPLTLETGRGLAIDGGVPLGRQKLGSQDNNAVLRPI